MIVGALLMVSAPPALAFAYTRHFVGFLVRPAGNAFGGQCSPSGQRGGAGFPSPIAQARVVPPNVVPRSGRTTGNSPGTSLAGSFANRPPVLSVEWRCSPPPQRRALPVRRKLHAWGGPVLYTPVFLGCGIGARLHPSFSRPPKKVIESGRGPSASAARAPWCSCCRPVRARSFGRVASCADFCAYWFYLRFGVNTGPGAIFFWANVLAGISALLATRLAARLRPRPDDGVHAPSGELLLFSCL